MKRLKHNFKKGMAFVLSLAMVAGVVPAMSGGANTVQAATSPGTEPSVSAYATKEQMMDGTFAPNADGTVVNYGKLVFGKKSDGTTAQEWYILGKDTGVSGDNTIIFSASPIATGQVFNSSTSNKTYNHEAGTGYGDSADNIEVYSNHYGASDLRVALQNMATNASYFTTAEQGLMNDTTVTTKDTLNSGVLYTTTDKLYALQGDCNDAKDLWAGTSDSTVLAMSSYWSNGSRFWLRSPYDNSGNGALLALPGDYVSPDYVGSGDAVQPASNLNLSSVLFASAATAASSGTVSNTIASETAMTLRLDGTGRNIGTVTYNTTTGDIKAAKDSTSQTVALVVQGNDGTNDWYYSKQITGTETVNVSAIVSESNTPSSIDLSTCKIWLETTDTDGLIYAVNADKEIEKINTTYVTKEQLMNSFKPYSDGTAVNIGKLVFGKKSDGTTAQQWYILGEDTGVSGDNTIIFAASPIATGQQFNSSTNNKTYNYGAGTGYGEYAGDINVYANHYGASDLRVALQSMADGSNTTYFTTAEQGLMNDTTVTTKDTRNSGVLYTTTDKLYALQGDCNDAKDLWAGSSDSTVLAMSSYWSSGSWFWLRSPYDLEDYVALLTDPGVCVDYFDVSFGHAVQPASNLNLSSVLFASAATAASSGTVSNTIASETAMTLRFDGTGRNIGTVTYNTTTGDIKAAKESTEGNVALVVQGRGTVNGEEKDWYYSKQITGTETVNVSAIVSESNTPSSIDLSTCKIWLETTDSTGNLIYAVGATEVLSITSVAITGIETPVANATLDTSASCATTGVSSTTPQIIWTPSDSTARYNTSYTASIILTADTGYEFADTVTATVSESAATSVNKNADGTLTVTYEFLSTAKRKIDSVTAPTVPTNNTFTTYYGYEGYDASPISGSNSELGEAATVTFEGTVAPTTGTMDVTWTIESAGGGAYDKTPGAENIFRWTIPAAELTNYDASVCQGYDADTGNITGTVMIKNKAATPVNITGTDSGISYTGATIDVSPYFTIDTHAGTATYSLITGTNGGTGEGTLTGTTLTVTKTGTFKIKVNTAANGIYGAGEGNITLTVANGTIEYTATDYSGTYDGQEHSISVNVTNPEGTTVTYSNDGINYGNDNPSFTDAGTYTIYYIITKDNYTTVEASKTVTINKKSATITAENQDIVWGNDINQSLYTKDGLVTGDSITEITLTPSTTALTENGTIFISGVKIENAAGADVTGNYDITAVDGTLKIVHNTALAPERIDAVKVKTSYTAGDTLNVDDLTVTAYYEDSYSEAVTGYTTNVSDIDMSTIGEKTLTISYTKNGGTKAKDIAITVNAVPVTEYTITATAGANGSISPGGAVRVAAGGSQTFTISPSSGYVIDTLKVDGLEVTATTSYTFSDVNANHTIEVTFKQESQTPAVTAPSITTQPGNATVKVGETATFTITAGGTDLTYQWQIDRNDGNGWVNITNATATSYTTSTVDISCSGFKYRCAVSNSAGTVTSNTAVLTVTENTNPAPNPVDYQILDGANSDWKQNTDGTITIRGNGDFAKFVGVKVDGSTIDAKNYTAKEGSTIITLTADYLKTLSVGIHTFEILWTDGSAGTSFTVSKNDSGNETPKDDDDNKDNNDKPNDNSNNNPATVPDDKNKDTNVSQTGDNQQITAPKTGDNNHLVMWVTLLGVSLAGLLSLLYTRKKKDNE